eukprot:UN08632
MHVGFPKIRNAWICYRYSLPFVALARCSGKSNNRIPRKSMIDSMIDGVKRIMASRWVKAGSGVAVIGGISYLCADRLIFE